MHLFVVVHEHAQRIEIIGLPGSEPLLIDDRIGRVERAAIAEILPVR
jgi:hypothetical protein